MLSDKTQGLRSWPTANYAGIPKPMKKTWSSQYGEFILDQFGGYVEGVMRYTNKNIGVLRGDASNTSFSFHWFNSADSGYACMTSQDGGKSWTGHFYDGFCSSSKQPKGSLTLK